MPQTFIDLPLRFFALKLLSKQGLIELCGTGNGGKYGLGCEGTSYWCLYMANRLI